MSNFVVQAKAVAGVVVASGADERAEEQLGCKVLAAEVAQSEVDPIPNKRKERSISKRILKRLYARPTWQFAYQLYTIITKIQW